MQRSPWSHLERLYQTVMSNLRGRLMWLSMLPLLLFAVVWMSYALLQRYNDLSLQRQQRAELLARQMAVAADYAIFAQNALVLQNITTAVAKEPEVILAAVYDSHLQTLSLSSQAGVIAGPADASRVLQLQAVASSGQASLKRVADRSWRYIHPIASFDLEVEDGGQATETTSAVRGYALVEVSLDSVYAELLKFLGGVLLVLAAFLLIAWSIVHRLSSQLDESVRSVADAAKNIGAGQTQVRLAPSRIRVFDELAQDLNLMAQRLEDAQRELERRVQEATQALREQKDAAERANSAKSRFLAAASHDLRQPIHALSLLVSAAQHETNLQLQARLLARIETGTSALSDLLNSLLDMSRLDGGGVRVQQEDFCLEGLMRRLQDTYQGLAQEKGLELVIRPTQACTHSDPALLERIIGNLLSNAIRYTPSPGAVYVAVRPRGAHWLVQVRDNGPGIAEQDQQAIFQEFVQLSNPQRDRSLGLGLGLAIVQRLVQLLGHTVELRSRPGQGSTFGLFIPRIEQFTSHTLTEQMPAELLQLSGLRIWVVEDDDLVRQSLSGLLGMWGAQVEVFEQSDKALAALSAGAGAAPQLLITDHRLGGAMNGLALAHAIRQRLSQALPTMLITGDTEDETLQRLSEPATEVLYKPVKPNVLIATMGRLLGANAQESVDPDGKIDSSNYNHQPRFETAHR